MGKASRAKNVEQARAMARKGSGSNKDRFGLYVTIAVIVIGALIGGIVIWANAQESKVSQVEASKVSPVGVVNDGFVINNAGLVDSKPYKLDTTFESSKYEAETNSINLYIDYACSHCADFEKANVDQLEAWLADGTVDTVSIHPMAFLSEYSLNAANALSCVAEHAPTKVWDAHKSLMAGQGDVGNPKKIAASLSKLTGETSEAFTTCVRGGEFEKFVLSATERAQSGPIPATDLAEKVGITGTPTVFVNGTKYNNNPADGAAFASFVLSVVNGEALPEEVPADPTVIESE